MPSSMARIPVRDTAPELALRAALSRLGVPSPELDVARLPGRPDVLLPAQKVAAFAHGCFWHHHDGCRHGRLPDTGYPWARKFQCTRARDLSAHSALNTAGWRVLWVWECALLGGNALPKEGLDEAVAAFLTGKQSFLQIEGRGVARSMDQADAA